ncbi:hypothetical protein BST30_13100 [Mycobacterium mantenii]|uniref:Uncharacterized protein n=1 Tax=Mycobacterium mantenii TaxID=560555 RepID=A0A1X0FVW3_MYCNT|nr:hypothetical protein BST30_13100 [Mycobacterium mantenii]
MLIIGRQLTDVVETANASSSTNRTFFPLVMTEKRMPARGFRRWFPHQLQKSPSSWEARSYFCSPSDYYSSPCSSTPSTFHTARCCGGNDVE